MCGIAGYWNAGVDFNAQSLEVMAAALRHRGPDYSGRFVEGKAGLIHERLSIIDLNERSNQPIHSHDGRFVMVYNGEVYNFNELATQFRIETKTTSDSEVVLELFVKKGVEFVNYMSGMFAIAIYDRKEERLFLFRDRVGIKPLFYYEQPGTFIFASELKALQRALPHDRLRLNHQAVLNYLHLGFIPAPDTIYENTHKLLPGELAIIDANGVVKRKWWSVERQIGKEQIKSEREALVRFDKVLNSAVQSRLISDVPVGTFLSGGIDSSLVSAVAARHYPGRIKTFTIGFEHTRHDETGYAAKVAKHIGSEHRMLYATEKEAEELLPDIISQYDEPFADTSAIPTMLVSRLAKDEVTVTLSGDGGDELFMGYGAHVWAGRLAKPGVQMMAPFYRTALAMGGSRYKRVARLFEKSQVHEPHIFSQEQYFFSQRELLQLVKQPGEVFKPQFEHIRRQLTPEERQALFDFKYYLPDDLLTKVDRASMRYALETRVPLLDYRMVEMAFNLDPGLRLKGKSGKYLLKQLLYKYVPKELFDRPKQGFSVPLEQWMKGPLEGWFNAYLDKSMLMKHGVVNPEYVADLQKKFKSPKYAFLYNRLWAVAALHAWLDSNT
ncbi:Asparagine synthetase [glutamine-hydrolyzing] 1 [Salinivirga cyanobacteriivorans]|uniref:asparagine synthase (glutamine-hydrolyzing) n=1 Tax=Salinivirga cyanobacteriivorans TaxID=1307839 RepID=A0A0S2HY40_9BACT|nr:asparagine synthase (glutamine-hydrolyzing) [Salinivirga cyanobacteriivorans]ALO14939.1 Asparagine synthetase [glutamine-hydrolyzing] 1 [Salinivirga cyanobacteriivorans]